MHLLSNPVVLLFGLLSSLAGVFLILFPNGSLLMGAGLLAVGSLLIYTSQRMIQRRSSQPVNRPNAKSTGLSQPGDNRW